MRRCATTESLLEAIFADLSLSRDEAVHVAGCPECARALALARRFEGDLESATQLIAPERVPSAYDLLAAGGPEGSRMRRYGKTLAAAAVGALLIGTVAVGWSLRDAFGEAPLADGLGAWLEGADVGRTPQEEIRGFEDLVRLHHLNPAAVVRLSDGYAVAAAAGETRVRVMEFFLLSDGRPHARELTGGDHLGRASSSQLSTLSAVSGDTGEEWNTFFYGTAPPRVSRVVVDGFDAEGGQVVDGAWVLVLREQGVDPEDLHWGFLDASGRTVDSGTGIIPAD